MFFWHPGANCWIGVRTPWSFADREIWRNSWKHSAVLLLAMALGALSSWWFFWIATGVLLIWSLGYPPYVYHRKYGTLRYWKDIGCVDYRPAVRCPHYGHLQMLQEDSELPVASCAACGLICRST